MAGGFEKQVKERTKELKGFWGKGFKVIGNYSKKGWNKLKNLGK